MIGEFELVQTTHREDDCEVGLNQCEVGIVTPANRLNLVEGWLFDIRVGNAQKQVGLLRRPDYNCFSWR